MGSLSLLFYLLAIISFGIAAFVGDIAEKKVNLVALGLAFFAVGHIV